MSFAPYHNGNLPDHHGRILGMFNNSETGAAFEFAERAACHYWPQANKADWPHVIFMADGSTRVCRVLKTRVHVAIGRNASGAPISEMWLIKQFRTYPQLSR